MRRSTLVTLALAIAAGFSAWACTDDAGFLTNPDEASEAPGVSANTVGDGGFTFLPPLVKQVTTEGDFNPKLLPSVEICAFSGTPPADPGATECTHPSTGAAGPLVLPAAVDDDHYKAEWDTDKDRAGDFRVFATLPGGVLGYVDVELAQGGGAKKTNGEDVEAIVENAGRTIPVQFHVATAGLIDRFEPEITAQDCVDCDTWSVPLEGGTFVLTSADGAPLAGIEFPDGWTDVPRDLLISCNNGDFCVTGDCSPQLTGPFAPGTGPLGSTADPTVIAEWPLFCEVKLDPPLGQGEFFGNPPVTDPNLAVTADLGVCQVDDTDPSQTDLHDFVRGDLEMGRNENGTFDRTGNTNDPSFTLLPSPPSFLGGCIGASAPVVDAGSGLRLPGLVGQLASAVGDVLAPAPLHATATAVLRDGGIGSTLGSVRTIYGAVEVAPQVTRYNDLNSFLSAVGNVATLDEDFSSFAVGTPISTIFQGVLDVSSTFADLEVFGTDKVLFGFDGTTRAAGNGRYDLTNVETTPSLNAIAFDITALDPNTAGPTVEVTTSAGTATFQVVNTQTEQDPVFIGFIATSPILSIAIIEGPEVGGGGNEEISLDNFVGADTSGPPPIS